MTLILNEIHLLQGLKKTMLVAAADRRISNRDGSYNSTRRKLFKISYLNGAIAHFGLAMVYPNGKPQYMSSWLPDFVKRHSSASDLQSFAESLQEELNRIVPSVVLKKVPSGFHICGYNDAGYPDFWYLSNIGQIQDFRYGDLKPQYAPPSSHFLGRDAPKEFGWDGKTPFTAKNGVQTYRNGDFRAHVAAWESLDEIYSKMLQFPDFKEPRTPNEYREYVKFKFEVIAYVYKKWAAKKIIARPIDVCVLAKDLAFR